jgi:chaperonin cofactor prefoldin
MQELDERCEKIFVALQRVESEMRQKKEENKALRATLCNTTWQEASL